MIVFTRLGGIRRLGNQMFQYARLRAQAAQLGICIHCPACEGDGLFDLRDNGLRLRDGQTGRIGKSAHAGYRASALDMADGKDAAEHFQRWCYGPDIPARDLSRFRPKAVQAGSRTPGKNCRGHFRHGMASQ